MPVIGALSDQGTGQPAPPSLPPPPTETVARGGDRPGDDLDGRNPSQSGGLLSSLGRAAGGMRGLMSADAWRQPPADIPALPSSSGQGSQGGAIVELESGAMVEAGQGAEGTGQSSQKQKMKQVASVVHEELTDFLYDWFGSLRLHHKEDQELQFVKPRKGTKPAEASEEAAVLGKATSDKSERRRGKLQVVKDPSRGKGAAIREEAHKAPSSITRVSDYRHSQSGLKGVGWGGPPIKRVKRKENDHVPAAQRMSLFVHGELGAEDEEPEGLSDLLEENVAEEDTEFFVLQTFPKFTVLQSLFVFLIYAVFFFSSGESVAGLESLFPGSTDLALTAVQTPDAECKDFRFQVWRAILYQYSHSSWNHLLGNVLVVVLCGISLEGFHGSLRMFTMFEIGVLGGAGNVYVFDSHARVIGMSGGAYAMLGMQLGDIVLNWERKSSPYRLILLFLIAFVELVFYLLNPREEISYSAHAGGLIAGLLITVIIGRNLTIKTYDLEKQVRQVSILLMIGLATFAICWVFLNWPPMTLTEQVQWCWARQVQNETLFGDLKYHCVRCDNPDCIARWSPPQQEFSELVSPKACDSWAITER